LVVDPAGWHTSPELALTEGIDVALLPPASPELQPAERLSALVAEPVANRDLPELDALETVLVNRCRMDDADRARIKSDTLYHWWPPEPPHDCGVDYPESVYSRFRNEVHPPLLPH
jgi:hypothetical protein